MHGTSKEMFSNLPRETIHFANERNNIVIIACLDIEKEFHKVWQNGLFYRVYSTFALDIVGNGVGLK